MCTWVHNELVVNFTDKSRETLSKNLESRSGSCRTWFQNTDTM